MIDHATGDITGFMMWLGKIGLAQARRGRPEVWISVRMGGHAKAPPVRTEPVEGLY